MATDYFWQLRGYINGDEISASFAVRIPFWGTVDLATVKGNLTSGVTVDFGVTGLITNGKARFYVFNGWLKVDLTATIFGTSYGEIRTRLMPYS
jgi:hypothetical protein